jgi:hypothetical protein
MGVDVIKTFFHTGKLMKEITYVNGIRQGLQMSFYSDGTLFAQWNEKNNQWNGIRQTQTCFNCVSCISGWRNDRLYGLEIIFNYA